MTDGRMLRLPPSYGTFHDQDGVVLPKCDVFFGPFKKTRQPVEMNRSHRRYFGADYSAVLATLPRIPVEGWKKVGDVSQIFYVRKGKRASGGFHHPFKSRQPTLWKAGRLYKLSLGEGCLIDDRGYAFPVMFLFIFAEYVLSHFGWLIGA